MMSISTLLKYFYSLSRLLRPEDHVIYFLFFLGIKNFSIDPCYKWLMSTGTPKRNPHKATVAASDLETRCGVVLTVSQHEQTSS